MRNDDKSDEMRAKVETLATHLTQVIDGALKEIDSYQIFRMLLDCTNQVASISIDDRPSMMPVEDNPIMSQSNYLIVTTLAMIQREGIEAMVKREQEQSEDKPSAH